MSGETKIVLGLLFSAFLFSSGWWPESWWRWLLQRREE